MSDSLNRLYASILAARDQHPDFSRTARLLQQGRPKLAKKLGEEALEVALEAVAGERAAVVLESADLIYNLFALWVAMGITPQEVEAEIDRREQIYGIAEKLPKHAATLQRALMKEPEGVVANLVQQ